jgi:hypothetical protein
MSAKQSKADESALGEPGALMTRSDRSLIQINKIMRRSVSLFDPDPNRAAES